MPDRPAPDSAEGNYVSEWYGHRVYPTVHESSVALETQAQRLCPFLSSALEEKRECIKPSTSAGVCTISSCSNGPRQDWLVCPYRAVDPVILRSSARLLFSGPPLRKRTLPILVVPGPMLEREEVRKRIIRACSEGQPVVVYIQDKLGGEISLSKTERSPELAFDITMMEIGGTNGSLRLGKFGILEVQTMDFHGSYRAVVQNLSDALRLHKRRFHKAIRENTEWLGQRIEGPNIANVFKRTFYQMMLKFCIGAHRTCAGCVLAIPESVWDSWQRHLGKPELAKQEDGTFVLRTGSKIEKAKGRDWILVFDIEARGKKAPNPLLIRKEIATTPEAISHFALAVAPNAALEEGSSADSLMMKIRGRLSQWWPELVA